MYLILEYCEPYCKIKLALHPSLSTTVPVYSRLAYDSFRVVVHSTKTRSVAIIIIIIIIISSDLLVVCLALLSVRTQVATTCNNLDP